MWGSRWRVQVIVPRHELEEVDVPAGPCTKWVARHGRRLISVIQVEAVIEGLARQFGSGLAREPRQGVSG